MSASERSGIYRQIKFNANGGGSTAPLRLPLGCDVNSPAQQAACFQFENEVDVQLLRRQCSLTRPSAAGISANKLCRCQTKLQSNAAGRCALDPEIELSARNIAIGCSTRHALDLVDRAGIR